MTITQHEAPGQLDDLAAAVAAAEAEVERIRQAIIDGERAVSAQELIDAEAEAARASAVLAVTRDLHAARAAREDEDARLARRAAYLEQVAPYVEGRSEAQRLVAAAVDEATQVLTKLSDAVAAYNADTEPLRQACDAVAAEARIDPEHQHQPHLAEERATLLAPPDELRAAQVLAATAHSVHDDPLLRVAAGADLDWEGVIRGQAGPYYESARLARDVSDRLPALLAKAGS